MKRAILLTLVLMVGVITGQIASRTDVRAAGPCGENGQHPCADTNGDGGVDITDAIFLLDFLFTGGDPPRCPAPPERPPCRVPTTGLELCYDNSGRVINCESEEWPGQDALYRAGCAAAERFVDNGDGTVTDTCTDLTWQQANAPGRFTWQGALRYAEELVLAGEDDWRLPSVQELYTLLDWAQNSAPMIDPVFHCEIGAYWTSTTRSRRATGPPMCIASRSPSPTGPSISILSRGAI